MKCLLIIIVLQKWVLDYTSKYVYVNILNILVINFPCSFEVNLKA